MKKIKIFFLSLWIMLVSAFCLASCGEKGLAGTYKFSYLSTTVDGKIILVYAGDEYEGVVFSEDIMTITLKEDGTAELTIKFDGKQESAQGFWEKGEGDVVLLSAGGDPLEVQTGDGTLTIDFYGTGLLTLEKE